MSEQVGSCSLTCVVLAGFEFAVGLLLHRPLVLSHLLQTHPCGGSTEHMQVGEKVKKYKCIVVSCICQVLHYFRLTVPFVYPSYCLPVANQKNVPDVLKKGQRK